MLLAPVALCLVPLIWQLPLLLCFEFRASSTCGCDGVKRRCKKKKKKSLTPQLAENVKIFGVLRAKATRKT